MCRAAETAGVQVVVCLHVERRGPAELRAWCSTAAHEHAMLEVRVRIPAPAPSSSASAWRRCCPVLPDEDSMHLWGSGRSHLAVNEAPIGLRTFESLPDAPPHIGPCTRVQPCLASTAGGERYSDGPPHDGRELESAEHRTLNPRGQGASPWRPTIFLAQGRKQWTAPCVSPGSRAGLTSGGPTSSAPRWPQGTHARRHDVKASIAHCP